MKRRCLPLQYAAEDTKAKIEEILSPAFEAVVGIIGAIILWCRDKFSGLLLCLRSCRFGLDCFH